MLANVYVIEKLDLEFVSFDQKPSTKYIELQIGEVEDREGNQISHEEAYRIDLNARNEFIHLTGNTEAGLLNGAHTIFSLYDYSTELPDVIVVDYPRYSYRGKFQLRRDLYEVS